MAGQRRDGRGMVDEADSGRRFVIGMVMRFIHLWVNVTIFSLTHAATASPSGLCRHRRLRPIDKTKTEELSDQVPHLADDQTGSAIDKRSHQTIPPKKDRTEDRQIMNQNDAKIERYRIRKIK